MMNLRVAEYDSGSGPHGLINDGAAAGSSLLIDHNLTAKTVAHVYTPGLEQRDGLGGALHIAGVDALGTVRAFVNDDSGQAVTDTFGTFAYGIPRNRTGSDAFTFAFAGADGYQTDPNGLILLGNRVYHVYTGRFLTRDPAGAGDNDYEYAYDNPLSYTDPLGLDPPGVTDRPGPVQGRDQWYPGDDFDATYGSLAANPNYITIHWWNIVPHDPSVTYIYGEHTTVIYIGGGTLLGMALLPKNTSDLANNITTKIENIIQDIAKRRGELQENPKNLPERAAGDLAKPRLSVYGHRMIINQLLRQKGILWQQLLDILGPVGASLPKTPPCVPIYAFYVPWSQLDPQQAKNQG